MKQNEFSDQVFDYIFPAMITLEFEIRSSEYNNSEIITFVVNEIIHWDLLKNLV